MQPTILLTNDDGIAAPGIRALHRPLQKLGSVRVVAPETERSAAGHAITLADPLRVRLFRGRQGYHGHAVSGTPADCVKIAVGAILDQRPHLLVSGINAGANVGVNVLYSGTVSAATEGAILGIPSLAVSVPGRPRSYRTAALVAQRMAQSVLRHGLPPGVSLNVNVPDLPARRLRGVRVTRMGSYRVTEKFDRRTDPRGNIYYWLAGEVEANRGGPELETDDAALAAGYVSVTPLFPDLTLGGDPPAVLGERVLASLLGFR